MPSRYIYTCDNGHSEARYRNASRCRVCNGELARGRGVPDVVPGGRGTAPDLAPYREAARELDRSGTGCVIVLNDAACERDPDKQLGGYWIEAWVFVPDAGVTP